MIVSMRAKTWREVNSSAQAYVGGAALLESTAAAVAAVAAVVMLDMTDFSHAHARKRKRIVRLAAAGLVLLPPLRKCGRGRPCFGGVSENVAAQVRDWFFCDW